MICIVVLNIILEWVFLLLGNIVHSQTLVKQESSASSLLCISPMHGRVPYALEKCVYGSTEKIPHPPHTCLVYVKGRGTYRCSVGEDNHFKVTGM